MKVDGRVVAITSVSSAKLHVEWTAEDWKHWAELQNSAELKTCVEAADLKLQRAANAKKGSGKGNKGQAQRWQIEKYSISGSWIEPQVALIKSTRKGAWKKETYRLLEPVNTKKRQLIRLRVSL